MRVWMERLIVLALVVASFSVFQATIRASPSARSDVPIRPDDLSALEKTGAAVEWEVEGLMNTLPPDPALAIDRIYVGAGGRFEVPTASTALLYVEHGPVALGSATGGMTTYASGDVIARNDYRQLVVENPGSECASVLRVTVQYAQGTVQEAVIAGPQIPNCRTTLDSLWASPETGIQETPWPYGRVYLSRVSWLPHQAPRESLSLGGPMVVLVDGGRLEAIPAERGQPIHIEDDGLLLPARSSWEFGNPDARPVHALVTGVATADPRLRSTMPGGRYTSSAYGYTFSWDGVWVPGSEFVEAGHDRMTLYHDGSGADLMIDGASADRWSVSQCMADLAGGALNAPEDLEQVRVSMGVAPDAFVAEIEDGYGRFVGCRAIGNVVIGITLSAEESELAAVLPALQRVTTSLTVS